MQYFMAPTAKDMLFCTGILFIQVFYSNLSKFFPGDFQIWSNSRKFPGPGKWICYFPSFLGHEWTRLFVKLHGCSIFYFFDFHFISSKVSTVPSSFNPNVTTTCLVTYLSGSNSQRGIIGALSARTYNAEVQGSDAWIHNHFVLNNRWFCITSW